MARLNVVVIAAFAALCRFAFAADLPVSPKTMAPQASPKEIPVQQNQPNCSRWSDECVTCTRGAPGHAATCSNIGFACQPKEIRCLSEIPQSEPRKSP